MERPVRVNQRLMLWCPKCGGRMRLRWPRENDFWDPFWGCMEYPRCKGVTHIDMRTGEPEVDIEELLRVSL